MTFKRFKNAKWQQCYKLCATYGSMWEAYQSYIKEQDGHNGI